MAYSNPKNLNEKDARLWRSFLGSLSSDKSRWRDCGSIIRVPSLAFSLSGLRLLSHRGFIPLQNKRGKSVTNITGGGAGSSRAELSNYLIHRHINSKLALFKPASSSEIRNDSNLCYCVLNLHFSCFTRSNPPLRDADNSDNDV